MSDDAPLRPDDGQCACSGEMTLRAALRWAISVLAVSGSDTPRLDAEVLLAHLLGIGRAQLYARADDCLGREVARRYTALVHRRCAHEPIAYLVGERAFYDVDLSVDSRVLIPRPETEHLVDEALAWSRQQPVRCIVDVGTGSGALAIVLARHLPSARVWALDLSLDALRVAARNIGRYSLQDRVALVCADLLSALGGPADLIVANLPYIAIAEWPSLPRDITDYEPRLALLAGEDGLALIARLLEQVPMYLARPGLLLLEIDHRQYETVMHLARTHLPDARVAVVRDYAGLERVVRVEHLA